MSPVALVLSQLFQCEVVCLDVEQSLHDLFCRLLRAERILGGLLSIHITNSVVGGRALPARFFTPAALLYGLDSVSVSPLGLLLAHRLAVFRLVLCLRSD